MPAPRLRAVAQACHCHRKQPPPRCPTPCARPRVSSMQLPKSLSRVSELADGFRSDDWQESLPSWVSAGLVLVLAWQLVQLLWTALSGAAPAALPAGGEGGPAAPVGPPTNVPAIIEAHLFGIAPVPGASELDPSAAPATQMNLVL